MFSRIKKIFRAHRSDDETARGFWHDFFLPRPTKVFFLRLAAVALLTWIFFRFFLMPCVIDGSSMLPTYRDHSINFCCLWSYRFSPVRRGDVVVADYFANRYLLKRVVALQGETVEFREGTLLVNGKELPEPYVRYRANWNLPPRKVAQGCCYIVGDNRGQPAREHLFGQIPLRQIKGKPLL